MADKSTKYFSEKQEKLVAKQLGGFTIGLSGAGPANPGDVKTYDWLIECKTHTEPDHPIFFDLSVWKKIEDEAMAMHRKPVLIVDDGSQKVEKTWCLCRAANLNMGKVITIDLPVKIRKNISCKEDKLAETLRENTKRYLGEFYQGGAYFTEWDSQDVVVMPLKLFSELFEL